MFPDLINKQVVCPRVELLQFMYPDFRLVKNLRDIREGEPFIYIGSINYINAIKKRSEPYIIVSSTGEYDLSSMQTLIELAYLKNGKVSYLKKDNSDEYVLDASGNPKRVPKVPKYVDDLIDVWSMHGKVSLSDEFIYNWKILWVLGQFPSNELTTNTLYLELLKRLSNPMQCLQYYLANVDDNNVRYLEKSLLNFLYSSKDPANANSSKKWLASIQQSFSYSASKNVPNAVSRLIHNYKRIDAPKLRVFTLLLEVLLGGKL